MIIVRRSAVLLVTGIVCSLPQAARADARLIPEISVGSTGGGVGLTAPIRRDTEIRLRYDAFSFGAGSTANENLANASNAFQPTVGAHIPFDANIRLANLGLFVDRRLGAGALYLTAGLIYNTNRIAAVSRPSESVFTIDGAAQNGGAFGPIDIDVRWNPLSPYLGLGAQARKFTGDRVKRGLRVDLGAYYQGPRRITVRTSGIIAQNPAIFAPYVDAFSAKVPGYLPRLPWYPVLRVSAPL